MCALCYNFQRHNNIGALSGTGGGYRKRERERDREKPGLREKDKQSN